MFRKHEIHIEIGRHGARVLPGRGDPRLEREIEQDLKASRVPNTHRRTFLPLGDRWNAKWKPWEEKGKKQ